MQSIREEYAAHIEQLAAASRRLGELGYVTSHGGNLSYRVADEVVLITPTQVVKRTMRAVDIVVVDRAGNVLSAAEGRRPTGETPMHLHMYDLRPDLNAFVHAHPPILTGFSMSDPSVLARPLLPEPTIEVGPILAIDYAEPVSEALARTFDDAAAASNAWLMRNHGVMIGSSEGIARALDLLEMCEAMAMSAHVAMGAGQVNEISRQEVANLENTIAGRNMPRPGDPREIDSLLDLFEWPEEQGAQ
jgi:L-fuculose-phosphate aldolase